MNEEFTPGTWTARNCGDWWVQSAEGIGSPICLVSARNNTANAYLIAAAPFLYHALEHARRALESRDQSPHEMHIIAAAKIALAKARGEDFDTPETQSIQPAAEILIK